MYMCVYSKKNEWDMHECSMCTVHVLDLYLILQLIGCEEEDQQV